ncbi:MAG: HAD-IA family hydrolase [Candidatus Binatia bacterium]|nr:HAD-IA family hydrolase [Candidatus Binatia bacterium]
MSLRGGGLRIRAVTFDAAGTLIEPSEPVGETYARIARACGLAVDAELLETRFREAYGSAPPLCFPRLPQAELAQAERRWWRDIVGRVFADFPAAKVDVVFERLFSHYAQGAAWHVFPDVWPTLQALQERGAVLGIVSNFDSRLFNVCAELGLEPVFRTIVVSSRVGFAKPNPGIFRRALNELGARAEESLHVGDSWGDDVGGAEAARMWALCVDRTRPARGQWIDDLRAVIPWLDQFEYGSRRAITEPMPAPRTDRAK